MRKLFKKGEYMKKIVLTGGGTAGHIYPALALVPDLNEYEIHYIGSNSIEKEILKKYKSIKFHEIPAVKLQRKLTFKNLLIPFKLVSCIKVAKTILQKINPDIIFSKGGYVSLPVVFAGKKLGIKIISHESDLSMGLANKLILQKCDIMCTSFPQTAKNNSKCIYTGQPIRKEILNGNPQIVQQMFGNKKPTLLVIGGSQGAKFINEVIWSNIDVLIKNFNIIHCTGKGNLNKKIKNESYKQIEYADNIGDLYAGSHFAISRAGCGVITELKLLKIPSLLIPLSKKCSRGDQIENAKLFQKFGYCEVMEEEDYTKQFFLTLIKNLLKNREKYIKNMHKDKHTLPNDKIIDMANNDASHLEFKTY